MSIRVPPKADPDTRNAFTDIEQELNELKSSVVSIEDAPPVSLASLQEQIELLNSKINELSVPLFVPRAAVEQADIPADYHINQKYLQQP